MEHNSVKAGALYRVRKTARDIKLIHYALNNFVWVIVLLFFLVNAFFTPKFATLLNIKNIFMHSAVLGVVVIGESLCLLSGHFDLSVESTLALSAVIGALAVQGGLPVPLSMLTMLASGALVGAFNGFLITKLGFNAFVATLISYLGVRGIALGIVRGRTIWNLPASFCILGASSIGEIPTAVVIMLLLYILMHLILTNTRFGRHIYLVGDNAIAARLGGIEVGRVVFSVFVLSGVFSAFAGLILAGRLNSASPIFAQGMVFEAMSAAIIGGISLRGGVGRLPLAFGGVILLSAISNVLNMHAVSPYWIQTIRAGMILLAVMLDALKRRVISYAE